VRPWNRMNLTWNRIALRMRVKLSNELTDGLFSPRKNNRINLLDKQLQGMAARAVPMPQHRVTPYGFREKTFNKPKKKQKKNIPENKKNEHELKNSQISK